MTVAPLPERMPLLDALKGVAAQVIVLHHLVSYGPLAAAFAEMLPQLREFLFDYGRMVVQVFLVAAGFLAARGLADKDLGNPLTLVWHRYRRLAPPFIAAMLLAVALSALARQWLSDEAIPAAPTFPQFVAHALLLHGILDVPALSAGVWYVAIDLQLYALMAVLMWLGGWFGRRLGDGRLADALAWGLVLSLAVASLFHFNRDAGWDAWAVYFFGAYALGALAWRAATLSAPALWILAGTAVTVFALIVDFRLRIALALSVFLMLALATVGGQLWRWPRAAVWAWLGRISFSVFLVHFPFCLVVNAVYARFAGDSKPFAVAAILAAWGGSVIAGAIFHRHVESRRFLFPGAPATASGDPAKAPRTR